MRVEPEFALDRLVKWHCLEFFAFWRAIDQDTHNACNRSVSLGHMRKISSIAEPTH